MQTKTYWQLNPKSKKFTADDLIEILLLFEMSKMVLLGANEHLGMRTTEIRDLIDLVSQLKKYRIDEKEGKVG